MTRRRTCMLGGFAALTLGLAPAADAAQYVATVVMSGLDNPRGLAFGPDGSLYVAEAGRGGDGPSIVSGDGQTVSYGASGALSRLSGGVQERILTGLPSLAGAGGGNASGLQDIAFSSTGELYGVIGLGANPASRPLLGAFGDGFGRLVRLPLGGGPATEVANLADHEAAENPDGGDPDTNPFGLVATPDGFVVTDAGANAVLGVTAQGDITTLAALSPRANPLLPFGPPTYQAVPTGIAVAPNGDIYFGELTGFPFPKGEANIYRLGPTVDPIVAFGGFTNLMDLAFGPDGALYALQLTTNGLASMTAPPGPGVLTRIDLQTGAKTVILSDGLVAPTAIAFGPDGAIYVTNRGTEAGGGQVLRIAAVPEPSTVALLGLGLLGLAGYARRRRRA